MKAFSTMKKAVLIAPALVLGLSLQVRAAGHYFSDFVGGYVTPAQESRAYAEYEQAMAGESMVHPAGNPGERRYFSEYLGSFAGPADEQAAREADLMIEQAASPITVPLKLRTRCSFSEYEGAYTAGR